MGLNDSFQLCSLVFGSLKLFYLSMVLYQIVFCNGWKCRNEDSVPAIFMILLVMIFPALMVTGIMRKNLRLLRICKVYNIVEKSVVIFLLLVTIILLNSVFRAYVRRHFVSYEDTVSVELAYAMLSIAILMTTLYMIFRNWMINGTIESVKRDLYSLSREQYVMKYNSSP